MENMIKQTADTLETFIPDLSEQQYFEILEQVLLSLVKVNTENKEGIK